MNDAELEILADKVAARLRPALLDTDPHFTREQAAEYLRISTREFDRERKIFAKQLAPNRNKRPLLWARSRLDVYRAIAASRPLEKTGS